MIIGEKSTCKTSMYNAFNSMPFIISEQATNSDLRGNKNASAKDDKTLLEKEILVIDEVADFSSTDSISTIKAFETNGKFQKYSTEETVSKCSIVKCGNNKKKIINFQDVKAKNILNDFPPEWCTEAVLSRQTALIYHSDILLLTSDNFIKDETEGLNVNIFFKSLAYWKEHDREIDLSIIKKQNIRNSNIITKAVIGLVNILYPDIEPPDYVLKALIDIAFHFKYVLENKYYNPFKMSNIKFWLELITPKDMKIEEGYLLENRILLKSGNKIFKIALSPFGALENEKEIEFFKKNNNTSIAKIYSESTKRMIVQKYFPLNSKNNYFNSKGETIIFDYEKEKIIKKHDNCLIKLILERGKHNGKIPEENFLSTTLYSDEKLENMAKNEIKKIFNPQKLQYISSSNFSYDTKNGIIIINYSEFI